MSAASGTESARFRAWARQVVAHRGMALLLTLALAALALASAQRLRTDIEIESLMARDSEELQVLESYRGLFGRDDVFLVWVEGDVFSQPYLERLRALHDALDALDLDLASQEESTSSAEAWGFEGDQGWGEAAGGSVFDQVHSLVNLRDTRSTGDSVRVSGLLEPMPAQDQLPALRDRVLAHPRWVGRIVDRAGTTSILTLRTHFLDEEDSRRVYHAVQEILAEHEVPGFRPVLSGVPALTASLNQTILDEMTTVSGLSFLALLLVTVVLFRHPIGVLGPLWVVGASIAWMYGFMAAAGMPLTMASNVLPAFILCVGIGDAVHIQSAYRDARKRGMENRDAIVQALARTGVPVTYTSLTTMAGLLSFNAAPIQAIGNTGTAGAVGVFAAWAHTVIVLPALLTFNTRSHLGARAGSHHDLIDRFLDLCARLSGRSRPWRTLAVALALCLVALAGTAALRPSHDPVSWLPADDPLRASFDRIDDELGGTANLQLLVTPRSPHGTGDLALLRAMEELEARVRAFQHPHLGAVVGDVASAVELVEEMQVALVGGERALPRSQEAASQLLEAMLLLGPEHVRRLATADLAIAQMTVRIRWLDAYDYAPLTRFLQAQIDDTLAPLADVQLTGTVPTLSATVASLIDNLSRSFAVALAVVTVLMVLVLRDLRLGLVAMVPNLLPVAYVLGAMGLVGVPIDLTNVLLCSFAIGLVVDDTIHFLHHVAVHHRAHGDLEAAITSSYQLTGRAMVITSVILVLGFLVLTGSDLASTRRFGALLGLTVVVALLADLIVTPAVLRLLLRAYR